MDDKQNKNSEALDDFWDLGKLFPARPKITRERVSPTATTVNTGDRSSQNFEIIPEKTAPTPISDEVINEYGFCSGLFSVKISRIRNTASLYGNSAFQSDIRQLWRKKCAPCRRVPYFSYMPSYRSMTRDQAMFYLYFRDRARHGEYIETEYSYILLYLFEIINIGSEIPAQTGARLMALIWRAYRDAFPALDRTAGEWLIDYCLINCVPLPFEIISGFLSGVCKTLKNPDVYLGGINGITSFDILSVYSSYDFRSSKRYLGNEALFDLHIPAAAMLGAAALANEPMPSDIPTLHTVSRAYTGALYIGNGVKIEVEMRSLLRSKSFCETVSSLIKTCENRIRAHIGAGKLSIKRPLPPSVSAAINGYFDNVFYDDEKKKTNASQDEEYLKLYEPENTGVADISRALGIEQDAWQTAIELDADILEEDEPIPLTSAEHDGDNGDPAFPAELIDLLAAAADGVLYDECRRKGINPIEAERLINEAAYDIIGDALMENGALIEDYRTEAEEIILRGRSAAKENR